MNLLSPPIMELEDLCHGHMKIVLNDRMHAT